MAKPTRIKRKENPIRWKFRSFKNWFYDKLMRLFGYVPITFAPFGNTHQYEKRTNIDRAMAEETGQDFEQVHYDIDGPTRGINWSNIKSKHAKLKELRKNA